MSAKIDTQSSEWQAGTTPRVLSRPRVGLSPTRLLNAAGTRPEPAVSVPRLKVARPAGTAHADEAGGELVEVGLADEDRARGKKPLHYRGARFRYVREFGARGRRRQAGDIEVVLDRKRNAVERQCLGSGELELGSARRERLI